MWRLVAITQFNIVFGVLLAFFSNYIITELNLGAVEWRWMFGVEALPAALFFILLFKNPPDSSVNINIFVRHFNHNNWDNKLLIYTKMDGELKYGFVSKRLKKYGA